MYMLKDEPDPPVLLEVLERGAVRSFIVLRLILPRFERT
jgi:hypothetical protein